MKDGYVLKKITQLLDERHWTLYRLSKEAETSYSTLNNSFQRNNVPSIPTLIRVCEGFGVTLSDFFNEGGMTVNQLTASDQQLLEDFHRLPKEDRRLVAVYMSGLLKVSVVHGKAGRIRLPKMKNTED